MDTGKIFISYSTADQKTALQLVEVLESHGLPCWISCRDIPTGTVWAEEIANALRTAAYVAVIVSESSVNSVHVPKELGLAASFRRRILPIRIDTCTLKGVFPYYLSDVEWIDAAQDWQKGMQCAVQTLQRELQLPAQAAAPAPEPRVNKPNSRRKALLIAAAALSAAVLLGIFFWVKKPAPSAQTAAVQTDATPESTPETAENQVWQTFELHPLSTITATEYEDAVAVVQDRLTYLLGADSYTLTRENNIVVVRILPDALAEGQDAAWISAYLFAPRELYFVTYTKSDEGSLRLPRSQISAVRQVDAQAEELAGTALAGMENVIFVEFKTTLAQAIREQVEAATSESGLPEQYLATDYDTNARRVFSDVLFTEDYSGVYFAERSSTAANAALTAYELQAPCFPPAFHIYYTPAVHWENPADAENPGTFQRSLDDIEPSDFACALFQKYSSDVSYGKWYDFRAYVQAELDALEMPYLLGTPADDPYSLIVAVDRHSVGEDFFRCLGATSPQLGKNPAGDRFYGSLRFTVGTTADGGRCLIVSLQDTSSSYEASEWTQYLAGFSGESVQLLVNDEVLLWGTVSGDTLVLDHSVFASDQSIPESAVPFLILLQTKSGYFQYDYEGSFSLLSSAVSEDVSYGMENLLKKEAEETVLTRLQQLLGVDASASMERLLNVDINAFLPVLGSLTAEKAAADLHTVRQTDLLQGTYLQGQSYEVKIGYYYEGDSTVCLRTILAPREDGGWDVDILYWSRDEEDLAAQLRALLQKEPTLWGDITTTFVP